MELRQNEKGGGRGRREGAEFHEHYLSKLTNTHYSLKNEGHTLYVTSPNQAVSNGIYFLACFVIIPLGGVTGLVAFGFFFSAGFNI